MAKCASCSAPLVANTQICRYCGVRNDIDLQGKHNYVVIEKTSERWCPQCQIPLQTISLALSQPLVIDRCEGCFGLFFDLGEIETLLENATAPVRAINLDLIDNINQERFRSNQPFKYLKCPVCEDMMNRSAFGHKSGVIVDRCNSHGIWLDGGEISHLLEWKQAGGQLRDEQTRLEKQHPNARGNARADIEKLLAQNQNKDRDWSPIGDIAEVIFSLLN